MTVTDQQKIMIVCAERERAGRTVEKQEKRASEGRSLLLIGLL